MTDWSALLEQHEHRPYPLPDRPWHMTMAWLDLLFAHWSFDPDTIRALLPPKLELDTFGDERHFRVAPGPLSELRP